MVLLSFFIKLRVFEALFLSGIPVFGYFMFTETLLFSDLLILYASSFLCALSVFALGDFFSSKNYLIRSVVLLTASCTIGLQKGFIHGIFPLLIFANWIFYYTSEKLMVLPDLILHFFGGILQFYFGVIFSDNSNFSFQTFILASGVSLAFTGGYIVDLVQDIDEDKDLRQKNLSSVLGTKISMFISSALFFSAYLLMYINTSNNILKFLLPVAFLTHLVFILSMLRKKIAIQLYRMFYRINFAVLCIGIFAFERLPDILN